MRRMIESDIPSGLALSHAAGWNQTVRDWRYFVEHTRAGCLVEEIDGHVAGTSATLDYGDEFAWIAMVLVDSSHQGKGIGTRLLEESIRILETRRAIRLDATPQGERVYRPLGFREEFALARYMRPAARMTRPDVGGGRYSTTQWEQAGRLDRRAFGACRRGLLEWLAAGRPSLAIIEDGGFCFGREGSRYDHIGPLVARDEHTARRLFETALSCCGRDTIVDAPEHARGLLEEFGFSAQRPFLRMCLGDPPAADLSLTYAITGPEFA